MKKQFAILFFLSLKIFCFSSEYNVNDVSKINFNLNNKTDLFKTKNQYLNTKEGGLVLLYLGVPTLAFASVSLLSLSSSIALTALYYHSFAYTGILIGSICSWVVFGLSFLPFSILGILLFSIIIINRKRNNQENVSYKNNFIEVTMPITLLKSTKLLNSF